MQKTNLRKIIDAITKYFSPIISDSWSKRSLLIISLLCGFYFTNSLLSFLLDKSVNTIFLALITILLMEFVIRSLLVPKKSYFFNLILIINNFRIGSTYALILEAFKLGS